MSVRSSFSFPLLLALHRLYGFVSNVSKAGAAAVPLQEQPSEVPVALVAQPQGSQAHIWDAEPHGMIAGNGPLHILPPDRAETGAAPEKTQT